MIIIVMKMIFCRRVIFLLIKLIKNYLKRKLLLGILFNIQFKPSNCQRVSFGKTFNSHSLGQKSSTNISLVIHVGSWFSQGILIFSHSYQVNG